MDERKVQAVMLFGFGCDACHIAWWRSRPDPKRNDCPESAIGCNSRRMPCLDLYGIQGEAITPEGEWVKVQGVAE